MKFIPLTIKPYPDELLYSWVLRLIKANGMSPGGFSNSYLGTDSAKPGSLPVDVRREFPFLYKNLYTKPGNIVETYLSLTTYPFESIFWTEGFQTKYVNNISREHDLFNPPVNGTFSAIRVCPECAKEETGKYGEFYYHRSHHLTGVCTCYKHGARLLEITKDPRITACKYDIDDFSEIQRNEPDDILQDYTAYAQALFEAGPNTNLLTVKQTVGDRLKELRYEYTLDDDYETFIRDFSASRYAILFRPEIKYWLKRKYIAVDYLTADELLPILMFLFPDVGELVSRINMSEPLLKAVQCDECGLEYITTQFAEENGWGCPSCSSKVDYQDRFRHYVEVAGKSRYEVISPIVSMNQHVEMRHIDCMETVRIKPRSFLFENVRCKCESQITFDKAKATVEAHEGFKLVSFTNTYEPVRILHEECGREFTCRYHKFVYFPGCRLCKPRNMNTELLARRIDEDTDGEFRLESEFVDQRTKITVRHLKCGRTSEHYARHFQTYPTCPYCNKFSEAWNRSYALLQEYCEEFGNVDIPKRDSYKGAALGIWCRNQRQDFKDGKLDAWQIEKLEALGFDFDPLETEWRRRYEQYKRYITENRKTYISRRTDFEGEHLGAWVETQRKWIKTGKMSEERRLLLLEINPDIFN